MNATYRDLPSLEEEWEFWFSKEQKNKALPKDKASKGSYYFILNKDTCAIEFISNAIVDVLGFKPAEFSLEKLFSNIHPDDLAYYKSCQMDALKLSNNLSFNEHYRYSFQHSFRLKAKDNTYHTIQQQYQTIEVNASGNIQKILVLHEEIEAYAERPLKDFIIYDKIRNKSVNLPKITKLTKRELEILSLVQRGFTSDEIAKMLFLSRLTVDTHRKNILHKTKTHALL